MKCAPSFEDLHAAHAGIGGRKRLFHPQTLVVSAYIHFVLAPRFCEYADAEDTLQFTVEELSSRIGLLPATVKTALKRCQDDGVIVVTPSSLKGYIRVGPIWPPIPRGGA